MPLLVVLLYLLYWITLVFPVWMFYTENTGLLITGLVLWIIVISFEIEEWRTRQKRYDKNGLSFTERFLVRASRYKSVVKILDTTLLKKFWGSRMSEQGWLAVKVMGACKHAERALLEGDVLRAQAIFTRTNNLYQNYKHKIVEDEE